MAALEVVQSLLISQSKAPLTNFTGGTSIGNPAAGLDDPSAQDPTAMTAPTTGDKVGAGILTAAVAVGILGGLGWLSMSDGKVW